MHLAPCVALLLLRGAWGVRVEKIAASEQVPGEEANICTRPWQVGLVSEKKKQFFCGGALINYEWVLTAGHCLKDVKSVAAGMVSFPKEKKDKKKKNKDKKTLAAGMVSFPKKKKDKKKKDKDKKTLYKMEKTYYHPRYNGDNLKNYQHDIGLVRITNTGKQLKAMKENPCIRTASLPKNDVPLGTECWVTGWDGFGFGDNELSEVLLESPVRIVDNQMCLHSEYPGPINDNYLCVEGYMGMGCSGDHGGPLVCHYNGNWEIHGVVSLARICNPPGPGIYTRVTKYTEWIEKIMSDP